MNTSYPIMSASLVVTMMEKELFLKKRPLKQSLLKYSWHNKILLTSLDFLSFIVYTISQ